MAKNLMKNRPSMKDPPPERKRPAVLVVEPVDKVRPTQAEIFAQVKAQRLGRSMPPIEQSPLKDDGTRMSRNERRRRVQERAKAEFEKEGEDNG